MPSLRVPLAGLVESLRRCCEQLVEEADRNDVEVSRDALKAFYEKHDPAKASDASLDDIL